MAAGTATAVRGRHAGLHVPRGPRLAIDAASLLMHRVDAARKLMAVPGKGAEATGRLFLAKRCHEAAKAGRDVLADLDAIEAEVLASLSPPSQEGVREEARHIRRSLQSP